MLLALNSSMNFIQNLLNSFSSIIDDLTMQNKKSFSDFLQKARAEIPFHKLEILDFNIVDEYITGNYKFMLKGEYIGIYYGKFFIQSMKREEIYSLFDDRMVA